MEARYDEQNCNKQEDSMHLPAAVGDPISIPVAENIGPSASMTALMTGSVRSNGELGAIIFSTMTRRQSKQLAYLETIA